MTNYLSMATQPNAIHLLPMILPFPTIIWKRIWNACLFAEHICINSVQMCRTIYLILHAKNCTIVKNRHPTRTKFASIRNLTSVFGWIFSLLISKFGFFRKRLFTLNGHDNSEMLCFSIWMAVGAVEKNFFFPRRFSIYIFC